LSNAISYVIRENKPSIYSLFIITEFIGDRETASLILLKGNYSDLWLPPEQMMHSGKCKASNSA